MPNKKVTKIDPRKELSPYLNHQNNQNRNRKKHSKVSASLSGLHIERRNALIKRLGSILAVSGIAIIGLGYYVSPLANVDSVQIKGAPDLIPKQVVANSGIKASDKVFDYVFHQHHLSKRLANKYPEIKNVQVKVVHLNNLILNIQERPTVGYIKDGDRYRKILANGKIGSRSLPWSKVDQQKPLFIGYNKQVSLTDDLKLFNSFPADFREEVKLLSGSPTRKMQIILVMKDGNVVIGNINTLKDKIKYYNAIKAKAGKHSLIDLEVGAFSRPLTSKEKKAYGIS
ncbi:MULTISPECIES: cell division protein FtsQ/DivIB [Lactobacillus]|uniref:cell division protein FtsQ/DivIB n=1 Tax=Lactobacillus TaxID=1578 RepID=UPI000CD7E4C4|nr:MULTISPECIES: FtsQ-type POTRA domain-containing protein [Lactobacillus]RVU73880.1 FtsQ-type POTRA domain-containing protein [Lactobacillus xujianguonis]